MFDEYQALKEDYDSLFLQLIEKDETIQGLQDCKQNFELEVSRLQRAGKKTDVVKFSGSHITYSTFDDLSCSPVVCKQDVVDAATPSHVLVATNDVTSLSFEKHIIGIGSRPLRKMEYTRGGFGKNRHGIDVPITPELKYPRIGHGCDSVPSLSTPSFTKTRNVLFVACGI